MVLRLSARQTISMWCPAICRPILARLEASEAGYRVARGAFWSFTGAVISRGLMFVASILVARILGKTSYGELGMIQSTVGMFGVFAGFSLGLTATKHVAEFRQTDPERAGRIIALAGLVALITGGLMSLGLFALAPWLAVHTINAPHLSGALRLAALMLFISALNGAQTGALAGFEAFKAIAQVNLLVGLVSFPVLLGGAYFGGTIGSIWALTINLAVNWLVNHWVLRREASRYGIAYGWRNCRQEWPVLWSFGLPAALSSMAVGPVDWACNALLVNRPNGYQEMGIYSAASQWYTMLLFLPGILGGVVLPVLSERLGCHDLALSAKTLRLAIKLNALFVLPPALVAGVVSPYIMRLYGEGFAGGWPTLVVVLLTASLFSVQAPVAQIIAASGRMWTGLLMNIGWGVVFLLGTLLLLDRGSLGVAAARALGYVAHSTWTFGFAWLVVLSPAGLEMNRNS
jgi:O-antigen/teichoic acid export membrane protein